MSAELDPTFESNNFDAWLAAIREGESRQVEALWQRYFGTLANSVRGRLTSRGRRFEDEEDIALSAIRTFCRRAAADEFAQLASEHELWKLLLTIAIRKANHSHRRARAARRGGAAHIVGSTTEEDSAADPIAGIPDMATPEPDDDLDAHEAFCEAFDAMPDDATRDVILLRLQGANNQEIAGMLNINQRNVQRRLKRAESIWRQISDGESPS
ncbi:MAG: ECF-type sigma factor [Planctomycetota bacterium]